MARWEDRRARRYGPARAGARTSRASTQSVRFLIGLILAASLVAFYAYQRWNAPAPTAIVGKAWVIDGDTIEIAGTRIRLEGIDAPEWDQTCTDAQGKPWPCGRAATSELKAHVRGRELTCNARASTATSGCLRYARCRTAPISMLGWCSKAGPWTTALPGSTNPSKRKPRSPGAGFGREASCRRRNGGNARASRLEQDDFSSNRHPAPALCLSMSFFAKPVPTFAGHALTSKLHAVLGIGVATRVRVATTAMQMTLMISIATT